MQAGNKKKMLYIMGVDWSWIYQRPQIIAEYLSYDFDITVAYPVKIWDKHAVKERKSENVRIHKLKLWTFPFQRKSRFVGWVADQYVKMRLKNYKQYDYIFIDYPIYTQYIPKDYSGCIIYDCIDDHVQMCTKEYMRRKMRHAEKELINRSNVLMVSSQRLLKNMNKLVPNKKICLIRNGTSFSKIFDVKKAKIKEQYTIGYIGTIAEWFDHQLLKQSVQKHSELTYHLIGPCVVSNKAETNRIVYQGVVEHSKLQFYVEDYDCLIMPFIVNEIVKSVDPVKLYEYIAFGKCIISVYYEELEYFKDYVYFYSTPEEYDSLLEKLIHKGFPPKYDSRQQEKFLQENSWAERYKLIREAVEQVGR